MSKWRYESLSELGIKSYGQRLAWSVDNARSDEGARKALNTLTDFDKFLEELDSAKANGLDPDKDKLMEEAKEDETVFTDYRIFSRHGFTVVFLRDPVNLVASAVLFYRNSTWLERH